ncbi:MAG: VanZ family protein [Gemmatimonadota bacterium]
MSSPWRRYLRAVPIATAIGLIALLTLEPRPRQAPLSAATPWHCLVCGPLGTVDVILNLALFLPLGFALFRAGMTPLGSALTGLGISGAVELLQATIVAGRDSSLSDLVTNALGAGLGALVARGAPRLIRPDPVEARRLAVMAAVVWLSMLGFTAWAVQPDLPAAGLTLRRAPIVPNFDRFPGEIRLLALNGSEREPGRLAPGSVSPDEPILLLAEGTLRSWPEVTAPVADLVDERSNPVVILGQLGQKVTFAVRARSQRVKLRTPTAKLYGALPPPRGQMIAAGGELRDHTLAATAFVDGRWRTAETRLSAGLGWMLVLPLGFYPFDYRPDITSAIWTALPLLLLGYWMQRSRVRPLAALLVSVGVCAAGLIVIPPLTGTAAQGWEAALACALALVLGWAGARYASRADSATVPPSARSAASP